jgi:hypothetical protein
MTIRDRTRAHLNGRPYEPPGILNVSEEDDNIVRPYLCVDIFIYVCIYPDISIMLMTRFV